MDGLEDLLEAPSFCFLLLLILEAIDLCRGQHAFYSTWSFEIPAPGPGFGLVTEQHH